MSSHTPSIAYSIIRTWNRLTMSLTQFFTEYDEDVSTDLKVDPLGMQVIWSTYGQRIFKNRISSISNDVRNYTLNLFHHYLIKSWVEDDALKLSKGLGIAFKDSKDSMAFKHACLVHLENLFVYSVLEKNNQAIDTGGVLGVSKAKRTWSEKDANPSLVFSHSPKSYILVRQTLLGVSGRYKTPLVEMGFFDKAYTYNRPKAVEQWKGVSAFVAETPCLKQLKDALDEYFVGLLSKKDENPSISFKGDVPEALKLAYVEAFPSSPVVGGYSRKFWLRNTELDCGAAGALLEELDEHYSEPQKKPRVISAKLLFGAAAESKKLNDEERSKFDYIDSLEPFLGDLDLLFNLMLSQKSQTKAEVKNAWLGYKRDAESLPNGAERIKNNQALIKVLSGSAYKRLVWLLKLSELKSLEEQIDHLLKYHKDIMRTRGQLPWILEGDDGSLKIQVKNRTPPKEEDRPLGWWVNSYYVHQFANLVRGFQGTAV